MEKSLAFYAAYHNEPRNKAVHFLFIWPIFFTSQVFFLNAPAMPDALAGVFPFEMNYCLLLSIFYAAYYAWIEQPGIAGPFAAALVMGGYFAVSSLNNSFPDCWKFALALHLFAWASQIFGHQVFEKRAPAFLDNLLQAIVMAPLFVVLEIFFLFGYKKSLHDKVQELAQADIANFRKESAKKVK